MQNPFDEDELKHQQIEYKIHTSIVDQFPSAFPTAILWHTPNRGGSGADGFFKKQMGTKKGASDLGISWNNGKKLECGWYEVKAPNKRPSPEQNKWLSSFAHLGWETGWGTSVNQAFDTFESWGIPRKHHAVKEPDLRSEMQKKHDAFEMYRP